MQYFKHFSTMRHDIKIKRVIAKYGLEGYGLYNLILESITEALSEDSPLPDLQENCEDIAEFYNGNTSKINEMMAFMMNQGLFELSEIEGNILCNKIYKFLDTSQTRSEKLRNMIRNYKEQLKLALPDMSQDVSDGHGRSQTNHDKSERKEEEKNKNKNKNKNKKRKEERYNPSDDLLFFKDSDFQEVWKDYMEVRTKKKASKSDRAIKSIISSLKTYSSNRKDIAMQIVAKSADSGWTGIFAMKDTKCNDHSETLSERLKRLEENPV